jgi:hypothetical protein
MTGPDVAAAATPPPSSQAAAPAPKAAPESSSTFVSHYRVGPCSRTYITITSHIHTQHTQNICTQHGAAWCRTMLHLLHQEVQGTARKGVSYAR